MTMRTEDYALIGKNGSIDWLCALRFDSGVPITPTVLRLVEGRAGQVPIWLRVVAGQRMELQTMYGLSGERRLTEQELSWLPRSESSCPVRIGNKAQGARCLRG
ncbi:hypothetical protein V5E97_02065 [Singulisphaera sp. Ch08]|uniref:Uncharacterized protein n=1 Tax=Singulisphaera sp. Ch08 TaxID=3120278 RepID=A0AAU7CU55_9BACT